MFAPGIFTLNFPKVLKCLPVDGPEYCVTHQNRAVSVAEAPQNRAVSFVCACYNGEASVAEAPHNRAVSFVCACCNGQAYVAEAPHNRAVSIVCACYNGEASVFVEAPQNRCLLDPR